MKQWRGLLSLKKYIGTILLADDLFYEPYYNTYFSC